LPLICFGVCRRKAITKPKPEGVKGEMATALPNQFKCVGVGILEVDGEEVDNIYRSEQRSGGEGREERGSKGVQLRGGGFGVG
jgi:hypothetical protein